ncbi:MAG: hypothetical protein ACJ72D_19885 [Marmoricola sp.]
MFKNAKARPAAAPAPTQPAVAAPAPVVERAAYAVEDYVALGTDELAALLARIEADTARGAVACAHLVITRDLRSGVVHHFVPCGSATEALALAARVADEKTAEDPERPFTVTVTPLLPH